MTDLHAPLAHADLSNTQGLTLDDLTRMHQAHSQDKTPHSEPEVSAQPESPSSEEHWEQTYQKSAPEQNLKRALELELEHDTFQLDQKDDLIALSDRASNLFQKTLPNTMERLSKTLHAREQINVLYDRLSDLSERRGAATNIIQTAKQIETLEAVLHKEQVEPQNLDAVQAEIHVLLQILQRYDQVFSLLKTQIQA